MMSNRTLRWLGTITYLFGMVLTAFNVYPLNLWGHLWGGIFWTLAACEVRDVPLFVIEAAAVITYGAGLLAYWMQWDPGAMVRALF